MTPTDRELEVLGEVNRRALAEAGGGDTAGIAAAVLMDGEVIAWGENRVHAAPDPTQHAEIVALGRAAAALGRPDLSGATLLSSLQPCEMCLAAMRFAGIRRLVFAARKSSVASKYFVFPGIGLDDFVGAGEAFEWSGGHREDEVLALYARGRE